MPKSAFGVDLAMNCATTNDNKKGAFGKRTYKGCRELELAPTRISTPNVSLFLLCID